MSWFGRFKFNCISDIYFKHGGFEHHKDFTLSAIEHFNSMFGSITHYGKGAKKT